MNPTARFELVHDPAINFAFQQNAIPAVKELRFFNNSNARRNVLFRLSTEPAFALPIELRTESIDADGEYRATTVDLRLNPEYLAGLNEKVSGWIKVEAFSDGVPIAEHTVPVSLLARNEWTGLASLPEILAAFVLPNDPAVMSILDRAADLLREHTGRAALNGYQDKNRTRALEQVAAIYRAVAAAGIRYVGVPASFEAAGQKIRTPSDVLAHRLGNCLDLTLLFAACCEQAGLNPLVLMHQGHAYAGCWLEERTEADAVGDSLQQIRKSAHLMVLFESTLVTAEKPGTLTDATHAAKEHLSDEVLFRFMIDVRRARASRIHPLPILGQKTETTASGGSHTAAEVPTGLGSWDVPEPYMPAPDAQRTPASRIDQWKSRLLDLSLRNRLLNFRETKTSLRILSSAPEHVEDALATAHELALLPKPKLMGSDDPRDAATYTRQQRTDALDEHLRSELKAHRLHTTLDETEHARRLTELFRSARNALDENGTNTLFAAVGILEWRETEHSDSVHRAPILLVPVELKRKSVIEGFSLRRFDEDTRLNATLMEMLRQRFRKEIPGLDPLPEDEAGVNVALVFQIIREAVRDLPGWELRSELWLGQFSFTKFLLWKDLTDRLDHLIRNRIVHHLVNEAGSPYPNPPDDIRPTELDDRFHPSRVFCPRSADSSQLAAVMAAAAGHDFVLEGPPGTGKSQTITNIIAHCLAEGKRVLFVAEKRAALDVVHRRLHEDGLAPFCLELHSNKSGKAEVLAQFDQSMKFATTPAVPDWEARTAELERERRHLNDYSRALHRPASCGLSAHDCLDYLLPRQSQQTVRFDLSSGRIDGSADSLVHARNVVRLVQERSRSLLPLREHPLASVAHTEWSPLWAETALEHLDSLSSATIAAMGPASEIRLWLALPPAQGARRDSLLHLAGLVESLLAPPPVGPVFATTPWNRLSGDLDTWITLTQERAELRSGLRPLFKSAFSNDGPVACEAWSSSDADEITEAGTRLAGLAAAAKEPFRNFRNLLESPGHLTGRRELRAFMALAESLLDPPSVPGHFASVPWNEWASHFGHWIALVEERASLRRQLTGYDEKRLLASDLDDLHARLEAARDAWLLPRLLKVSQVRRRLRSARPDGLAPEKTQLQDHLDRALRLQSIHLELADLQPALEAYLGPVWGGGEPGIDSLRQSFAWGETLHGRLGDLAGENTAWISRLRDLISQLLEERSAAIASEHPLGEAIRDFRVKADAFDKSFEAFLSPPVYQARTWTLHPTISRPSIPSSPDSSATGSACVT